MVFVGAPVPWGWSNLESAIEGAGVTPQEFYDPNFDFDTLPPFPDLPARKHLIWLASYPKSGNTWVRLFLSAYLSGKAEMDINDDLNGNNQCTNPRFNEIIAKKPVRNFTDIDSARARVGVQRMYARSPQRILVKTHSAVAHPGGHPSIDPESTFATLLILRNPLAVLPSFARHMSIDISEAVTAMRDPKMSLGGEDTLFPTTILSSWSSFNRSWIASQQPLNVCVLKYEDMKQRGPETFARALAHLGQPADQARIQRALETTAFDKMKTQDLKQGFKERTRADRATVFFRSGKVDGWRTELTEAQVVATIEHHWDVMEQLDYIPDDLQGEFETIKFKALEAMVAKGVNIGVYAQDLNALRAKRGIQSRLSVKATKTQIGRKAAQRARNSGSRPQKKRTFG